MPILIIPLVHGIIPNVTLSLSRLPLLQREHTCGLPLLKSVLSLSTAPLLKLFDCSHTLPQSVFSTVKRGIPFLSVGVWTPGFVHVRQALFVLSC